jgi:hypothetical protein
LVVGDFRARLLVGTEASLIGDPLPPSDDTNGFIAIEEFAEKQISLWVSVREAAWRRERTTLELHCPQIKVLTVAVFQTVKQLGAGSREKSGVV